MFFTGGAAVRTDEMPVVRGSDRYQMGASAARISGARVLAVMNALSKWARATPRSRQLIARQKHDEGLLAEMDGAARALGVSRSDLLAARTILESIAQPACTNFGAVSPATVDGAPMLSWNFDVPPYFRLLMGSFPLFVRALEGTNPYLCMGIPALFGIGVMNSEGLTSVVNAVGLGDDGDGYTPFELNNIAMETCSTVEGAARVLETGPRQAIKAMTYGLLMNWNTLWADSQGNLSLFECSHNHFNEKKAGPAGYLASANHHQFLDQSLSGGQNPRSQELISGSYARLGRMYSLLEEYHGRLGPREAKLMISDHIPDYSLLEPFGVKREWWEEKIDDSTICAHAWNLSKHLARGEVGDAAMEMGFSTTVYSFQLQPLSMTSWFTDGHPCRNSTVPIYWGRLLGSEVERYPGAIEPEKLFKGRVQRKTRLMFSRQATGLPGLLGRAWMYLTRKAESGNFK
jgi:hypothetical protein